MGVDLSTGEAAFDWTRLVGSAIPLFIEIATLVKVLKGSKNKFAIKILAMLTAYNLTNIVTDVLFINMTVKAENYYEFIYELCKTTPEKCPTKELQASNILTSVGFLLFNISHWMFAHRYF